MTVFVLLSFAAFSFYKIGTPKSESEHDSDSVVLLMFFFFEKFFKIWGVLGGGG
jgi:hypothetical protein